MTGRLHSGAVLAILLGLVACFPGGIVDRGGYLHDPGIVASATLTRGAPYDVLCWDEKEAKRRRDAGLPEGGNKAKAAKTAPAGSEASKKEANEKSGAKDTEPGKTDPSQSGQVLGPPVRLVPSETYRGGCEVQGQHSMFYLLNVFPVTPTLSAEYAISSAVQRLEGDTMVRIQLWHEVHYYSVLGRAAVVKVRGDVIRFRTVAPKSTKESGSGRR